MNKKLFTENNKGDSSMFVSGKKKWKIPAAVPVVMILLIAVLLTACSPKTEAEEKQSAEATAQSQDLVIPVNEITADARFYSADVEGTKMEVVAVKAPDGTIRTAFNTCQVCYDSGRGYYKQDGDVLVCQNCGNRFPMSRVEVEAGGCNPWPIFKENKTVTDGSITISYDFLKESRKIFAKWRAS